MKIRSIHFFFISIIIHLLVVSLIAHYKNPQLWENGVIANNLYNGNGFILGFSLPNELTSVQAPAYPYLLSWSWDLFGKGVGAYLFISILQCLCISSMVFPMSFLSRRWFPTVPVWIVQVITIIAPLYLWYCTRLHHTALVMALHPWILWGWLGWAGRNPLRGVITGVATGILALIQPVILGAYGIIGLGLLVNSVRSRNWIVFQSLALGGLAVIATLTPWTIRNYSIHGKIIPIKCGFGKEFWMGNNPHATGTSFAIGGAEEITNVFPPKCYQLKGKVPEGELEDAMYHEASAWIAEHPSTFIRITAHKLLWFWTFPPKDLVRSSGAGEALVFRGIFITYWSCFIILTGLAIWKYRPPSEYILTLAIFSFYYSLVYGLTHVGQARFRGEIEFLFLPAVAAGVCWIFRTIYSPKHTASHCNTSLEN